MKFLIFNIVVVAALIHLYSGKDMSLSEMKDWAQSKTEQIASKAKTGVKTAAETVAKTDPKMKKIRQKQSPPLVAHAKLGDFPAAAEDALDITLPTHAPNLPEIASPIEQEIEVPMRPVLSPPAPSPEAQQRRADILSDGPVLEDTAPSPTARLSRRQELLSMAEDMEFFSVEAMQ